MESLLMLCVLASAGAAQPPAEVTFDPVSQTVSVSATAVPRGALVAEIARQSGVRLVTDDPLPLPISVAFRDLPLALALRRVLGERSFVLEHRVAARADGGPRRLWILPADGPASGATEPPAPEPDRRARLAAAAALATADSADAIDALEAWLNDPDPAVRREAVHALGERADERGPGLLARALGDPDAGVRQRAAEALGGGGAGAVQALAQALEDADADLRQRSVDALARIGGPGAEGLLHQALTDADPAVREAAAEGLAELAHAPGPAGDRAR